MDILRSRYVVLVYIVLVKVVIDGEQKLVRGPEDTTAIPGGTFVIPCVVEGMDANNDGIHIYHQPGRDPSIKTTIYQSYPNDRLESPEKYSLSKPSSNHFEITVKNVEFGDGGVYLCDFVLNPASPSLAGTTIVLGTPTINVGENLQANENARISCTAEYSGFFESMQPDREPQLMGYIADEPKSGDVTRKPGSGPVNPMIQYVMNATLQKTNNGQNFACRLSTVRPAVQTDALIQLDVKYAVEGLVIAPKNDGYYPGEFLNCTAQGNPDPGITWVPISSSKPRQNNAWLEIVDGMGSEGEETWQCRAANTPKDIPQVLEEKHTFKVLPPTEPPDTGGSKDDSGVDGLAVGFGVTIPIIIIVIVVIIGVILVRRSRKKPKSNGASIEELGTKGPCDESEDGEKPKVPKGQKVVRIDENVYDNEMFDQGPDSDPNVLSPDAIPSVRTKGPGVSHSTPVRDANPEGMTPSNLGMRGPPVDMSPSHPGMRGPPVDMSPSHPGMRTPATDMTLAHSKMWGSGDLGLGTYLTPVPKTLPQGAVKYKGGTVV